MVHDASEIPSNQVKAKQHACTGWGLSGNAQRNLGMLYATGELIYFLDDDNILHPEFGQFIETVDPTKAYVFNQAFKDGRLRLKASRMGVGGIDTAMFVLPKELATDVWWELYNYCADGVFAGIVYNKFPERFVFIDRVLAYYNYLT